VTTVADRYDVRARAFRRAWRYRRVQQLGLLAVLAGTVLLVLHLIAGTASWVIIGALWGVGLLLTIVGMKTMAREMSVVATTFRRDDG
jgi:cobalamin biosynthesis protein CobD/CbiB